MRARDILVKARARIQDPARWCQGAWYRDPETGRELEQFNAAVPVEVKEGGR